MGVFDAIILGLVQGITEFLPISSSGHLLLASKILGLESLPLSFTLSTHFATLIAIIIVLKKDIFSIIKKPFCNTTLLLLCSSIATIIIFIAFKPLFALCESGNYLVYCFIVTAIVITLPSLKTKKMIKLEPSFGDSIAIGIAQGIAVLPGISRSGMTISMSLLLGIDKETSTRYSFLLCIPIIVGSCLLEFISTDAIGTIGFLPLLLGSISAFFSGLFCLKFMLKILKNFSLDAFALYLLLLSIFLLLNDYILYLF